MRAARRVVGFLVLVLAALASTPAHAAGPAKWKARLEPADVRAGETAMVVVEATIEEPWHIYSMQKRDGPGPLPTSLELAPSKLVTVTGKPVEPVGHTELDPGFKIDVTFFPKAVAFGIPVRVAKTAKGKISLKAIVRFMACREGTCTRPLSDDVPLSFAVSAGKARPERMKPLTAAPKQPAGYEPPVAVPPTNALTSSASSIASEQIDAARRRGPLAFVLFAFVSGLTALLTPCVFPMIPITVSFFTKQQENAPGSGIRSAVAYCLGIIGTFTALGVLMSVLLGPQSLQRFATHPFVNLALGVLFIVMAVNLFGGFEIILPSWLVEKAQSGSSRGGLVGPLLMGLTFTLTSFTCTVAFVGTLLATAATSRDVLYPILGMLAFSTAFAAPFFLLAVFPQYLAKMPKSGGWLVTVKAYMGFLELLAALKFLSNVDLYYQWEFLTRPVFLACWFAVCAIAGLYMLGLLRLPHDPGTKVGPVRAAVGVLSLAASVWMLTGVKGGDLPGVSAFLPRGDYGNVSFVEGLEWTEDYDAALRRARQENKLLFVDFTGDQCSNCRLMESDVFPKKEVMAELSKMVLVRLYTDRNTEQSRRYARLQVERFGQSTLPLYVILSPDEVKVAESSFDNNPARFRDFLRSARLPPGGRTALR